MVKRRKKSTKSKRVNIARLYKDLKFSASYSGKTAFTKAIREKYPHITKQDVAKELMKLDAVTLHKQIRKPAYYRKYYIKSYYYLLQADLTDMRRYKHENNGWSYILFILNAWSRKLWVYKLKDKTSKSVINALRLFLEENPGYKKIQYDAGNDNNFK